MSNCRERWRNIRGAFLRSLKKPPKGSGINAKKKYYLNGYLEFLLPYIKNKPNYGNLGTVLDCSITFEEDNSDSEDHTDNQKQPRESQVDQKSQVSAMRNSPLDMTDENTEGSGHDSGIDKSVILGKRIHNRTSTKRKFSQTASTTSNSIDDTFIEWLKTKTERDSSIEHPNMSFLRSLLPDMMKMTDKQNRRFRQKVIGLIDDILEEEDILLP